MANKVYANGREIACKSGSGKSIAAFPDVCLSPPSPPAGPVPIPYPVTAEDGDTDAGSKQVKISGKEVMLKNESNFKKCTGDEASTKSLGMGVVTHKNTGKLFFAAWSMDVKIEGQNAVRHLDLVTQNHASMPGNTPTWPYLSKQNVAGGEGVCKDDIKQEQDTCGKCATEEEKCKNKDCAEARKCMLVPYKADKGQGSCCPGQTPHHLIEVHCFTHPGGRAGGKRIRGFADYDDKKAPCVCCDESSRYKGDHGSMHAVQGVWERAHLDADGPRSQMGGGDGAWTYGEAKKGAVAAMETTFPDSACAAPCIEAQLDNYHRQMGCKKDTKLRADRSPLKDAQKEAGEEALQDLDMLGGGPAGTGMPGA